MTAELKFITHRGHRARRGARPQAVCSLNPVATKEAKATSADSKAKA